MRVIVASIYYRLITDFRIPHGVFFTLVFPVFLFVVFHSIWGEVNGAEYTYFLMTGILGATLASEGMYAIGGVIKEYYDYNLIRYFKILPTGVVTHFASLAVSRVIFIVLMALMMSLIAIVLFDHQFQWAHLGPILIGGLAGMLVFSSLGLVLCFTTSRIKSSAGFINFAYFIVVFLSDAYYPLEDVNPGLYRFANLLPLNHVLNLIRGEHFLSSLVYCGVFSLVFFALFAYQFNRYQLKR
jgi:ABC-2 type transport system permease protein